ESDINEAIARYYPGLTDNNSAAIDEALKEIDNIDDMKSAVKDALDLDDLEMEGFDAADEEAGDLTLNDAPVINLVNMVISEAIKAGASDIHIEPYEKKLRLR